MGIRDEEVKRLVSYAAGLGVKVSFKQLKKLYSNAAEWHVDGTLINVYTWPKQSKIIIVLSLVHELAHHRHWIDNNRQPDKEFIKALTLEDDRKPKEKIPKKYRNLIYQEEVTATEYWDLIIKDVHIKIKKERVELEKQMDIFVYKYYLDEGKFPSHRIMNAKKKELKNEIK